MNHIGSTFLSGCCGFYDYIFFSKEVDSLSNADEANSSFFIFDEQHQDYHYGKYDETVGWSAISMATVKREGEDRLVVAISPYGDYWEVLTKAIDERYGRIAEFSGNLRKLANVNDEIFACGMDRVVLRRASEGVWQSIGPGSSSNDTAVVGFEAIDGFSSSDLYAVGWGGEIWRYKDSQWFNIGSPVSRILTSVHCASDGMVYIVGHDGILLRGREDEWEVVETGRSEIFRDVKLFNDVLYIATDFRIFQIVKGNVEEVTNYTDDEKPSSCLHLLLAEDGLISMGQKDVFRTKGMDWERLV